MTAEDVILVCTRCTRFIVAEGPIKNALQIAEQRGWKPDGENVVCPKCPSGGPRAKTPPIDVKVTGSYEIEMSDSDFEPSKVKE